MTFSFLFEKRQNSFSWDPALVHSGLQNTQIKLTTKFVLSHGQF